MKKQKTMLQPAISLVNFLGRQSKQESTHILERTHAQIQTHTHTHTHTHTMINVPYHVAPFHQIESRRSKTNKQQLQSSEASSEYSVVNFISPYTLFHAICIKRIDAKTILPPPS